MEDLWTDWPQDICTNPTLHLAKDC